METSMAYAVRGQAPDRSRYCYEMSATVYNPDPSDLQIDDALSNYVQKLSLISGGGGRRSGHTPKLYEQRLEDYGEDDRYSYTSRRSYDDRVRDPVYPGVYSGQRPSKAIAYYPQPSPSEIDSRVSSRRSSRHHHHQRRTLDAGEPFQSLKYVDEKSSSGRRRRRREEDDLSIWPEDSASQVSTRAWTEPRGRSRRRDGSVVSMSTRRGPRSGGGQSVIYEDDEVFEQYATKDITPYVMARR